MLLRAPQVLPLPLHKFFFPVSKLPSRLRGVNACHWQPSIHFPTVPTVPHIFLGKSIPSTLNHVVYGSLALYTAPGVGPDRLELTAYPVPQQGWEHNLMPTYKLFPQAHGALERIGT